MIQHSRILFPILLIAVFLMSCSFLQECGATFEDSLNAKTEIEKELGVEVGIEFKGKNGEITYINVVFAEPPAQYAMDSPELKATVQEIVERNFRQPVPEVVLNEPMEDLRIR